MAYRIVVDKFNEIDISSICQLAEDKSVCYYSSLGFPFTKTKALNIVQKSKEDDEDHKVFAVRLKETGELIGGISLKHINQKHKNAEIGIWTGTPYQGKGYAKEALNWALEYAFAKLKLKKVYAFVRYPNTASINFFIKSGFHQDGIQRSEVFFHNEWLDIVEFSLLNEEWQNSPADKESN